ncbi:MAG: dimethylargininase [Nitrospinaceae bacterium]|nr:MAG: dimethylargininase [Nitrospinaceae bacterium]
MSSPTALVRKPSPAFVNAISCHPQKHQIDYQLACEQHQQYIDALQQAGAQVVTLEPLNDFPDSPFVEDTAVIFGQEAWICSMKAESRQGETKSVAEVIKNYRAIKQLKPPATLDGGDVLMTSDAVFVGQSTRTNREAVEALQRSCTKPCLPVAVKRGLHLKSAASYLGGNLLVIDPASIDASLFQSFEWIEVEENERYAANCLTLGKFVLMPAGFPRVADQIRSHGFQTLELKMSEFEKADGGVTCLSIIL